MKYFFLTIVVCLCFSKSFSQYMVPQCPDQGIYLHDYNTIKYYNPNLPLSATNPSNTNIPYGGTGLYLGPNLNAAFPNPTFYTNIGGKYNWWNGTNWVNTNHNASAVNIGGGGGFIYNLEGGSGRVYKYDGTGNDVLLITIASFGGGGPYDLSGDCNGNFTIIKCTTPQYMNVYNSSGALVCTYSMTGMPSTSAGGGFAVIGSTVYVRNTGGFWTGNITGNMINFTLTVPNANITHPGDFASCPNCFSLTATSFNTGPIGCVNGSTASVVATTTTSPASYSWTGPSIVGSTTNSMAVVNQGGVYTCTVTAGLCPGGQTVVTTTVTQLPPMSASITSADVLCFGTNTGSATVSSSGGTGTHNYLWTNGNTTQTITGVGAGSYSVTVTDSNNCAITLPVTINQPPALNLTIVSNTASICLGGTINVNGMVGGGTLPYNYTWTPGPNTSMQSISETVPGTYNYKLDVVDGNGCPVSNNINLTFHPIPVISITSQSICYGDLGTLTASGTDSYRWMPGNYTGNTYTTIGVQDLELTVVGTSAQSGCNSLPVTATLVVHPLPTPQIVTSENTGCVPLCMTFTANNTSGGIQNAAWLLGDGSFANTISTDRCFSIPGIYTPTLEVTDVFGCKNSTTYSLEAYPIPVADFNYAPLKPIVNNAEVTFTDASYNAKIAKWDWYFMNLPKPHSDKQNPTFMYTEAGTYPVSLLVKSNHGCSDTVVKTLVVGEDYGIFVPNAFTPNGDGLNDVFQPKGFGITKYELQIFDRWGEKVFSTNNFEEGWDGNFHGKGAKIIQNGNYVWRITLTNVFGKSHELTGHVTLMK